MTPNEQPPLAEAPKRSLLGHVRHHLARRRAKAKAKAEKTEQPTEQPHAERGHLEKKQHTVHGHAPAHAIEPGNEPLELSADGVAQDSDVEKSLEAIYAVNGKTKAQDLDKIERTHSWRIVWMFAGFALVAVCIAGAVQGASYFWKPFTQFRGPGLQLVLHGPTEVTLGKEQMYVLEWVNQEDAPLRDVEVRVGLPQDFQVSSFDPEPEDTNMRRWTIGDVAIGGRGSLTVKGIFLGQLGDQSAVQGMATYRPDGYTHASDAMATMTVTYRDSVLLGNIILPPKILAGDPVTLRYVVTNRGDRPMTGLYAHFILPTGFLPSAAATSTVFPNSLPEDVYLPLQNLDPNVYGTAQVSGSFFSGITGDVIVRAEAGRRSEDGRFLAAQRNEARVPLIGSDLALRLVANGSDADQNIDPGQPIHATIAWQNTSSEPIKGAAIVLGLASAVDGKAATGTSLVDWTRLDDPARGVTTTKAMPQTIRYDQTVIPAFETLAPQSEGTIEIGIPTLPVASGTKDAQIVLTLDGFVPTVGNIKMDRKVSAPPLAFRYRSRADAAVEARYFTEEGAPIGSGPLPPVVAKTTGYRVIWHLSKQFHTLANVRLSAVLPNIAAFGGNSNADAGEIKYDEASRTVSWTLPEMAEATQELDAWFDVQVTPATLDAGRFASVLGETRLEALDRSINEPVSIAKPPLTTDLENDEGARGKGVVKEKP